MAFFGKYGNLSTIQTAISALTDIAEKIKREDLMKWNDVECPFLERYESLKLARYVEGLQRVLWLNGGCPPQTWLPIFFDYTKEHNR
jgi:hypothetical protein